MAKNKFTINLDEKFPHLSKAPIVEAVIDIRVVPTVPWDEAGLQTELKKRLSAYPKIEPLRESRLQFFPDKPDKPVFENFGCVGFKLTSEDNTYITQFKKNQFVCSRLKPYEDWGRFNKEAMSLLAIYCELLKPTEVQRVGLRFINRIVPERMTFELSDYYESAPEPVRGLNLPLEGFLHHDIIQVPETAYLINLIKTVQKSPTEIGLILDIDVFTQAKLEYNEKIITKCLEELCWLKNKIFFNSITKKIIKELA